ncbi:MAG: phosphatidylserine/phosphatidylglycerophosphate/cardiolipin synthase family protein [Gammaproteobacteria bacterium]|nr:phosphatidylserine/phosphatidylglycerophosphate/cardiolipin synthase family protein [Gammaproteobacteria bacterium]
MNAFTAGSASGLLERLTCAGWLFVLFVVSGCASWHREDAAAESALMAMPDGVPTRDLRLGVVAADEANSETFSRGISGAAGMLGIMLKTYATDPVARPISTATSLVSLIRGTVADVLTRTSINVARLAPLTEEPIAPLSSGPGMDLAAWERELDAITGSPAGSGSLEFLVDGEQYFTALLASFERAQESIHIRTYIFDNDDFALDVADLLKARSRQVDVKVLMDGIGTLSGGLAASSSVPASFEPPESIARYLRDGSGVQARTLTNAWFAGDHAKVTIIDREVAYLGGMNIGREYRFDWHDLMVEVRGPIVAALARDSDIAWARSGMLGDLAAFVQSLRAEEPRSSGEGHPVRLLYTRPGHSQIYRAKLAAIRRAQRYIFIENPYFSDDAILHELIAARRRGVDVRFVIAERGDFSLMDMSNVMAVNEMLANGIRVYLYPRMTHAKAFIADGWLMVGSANLDKLSLRVNDEINIATSHPSAVAALEERLFRVDFASSTELTERLPQGPYHILAELIADVLM